MKISSESEHKLTKKLCPVCKTPQEHQLERTLFSCKNLNCNHECLSSELLNPPDSFESHRLLAQYAKEANVQFYVGGQLMPHNVVFQPEFFLPIVVAQAYRIWQRMSYIDDEVKDPESFGAVVFDSSDSLFGVAAQCPPIKHGDIGSTLRMLTLTKATEEVFLMEKESEIDLDGFIDSFQKLDWSDGLPVIKVSDQQLKGSFRNLHWKETVPNSVELEGTINGEESKQKNVVKPLSKETSLSSNDSYSRNDVAMNTGPTR